MSNRISGPFPPDDRVDQAAAALRSTPIPAGPPEDLLARTIARLENGASHRTTGGAAENRAGGRNGEAAGKVPGTYEKGWWNMRVVRRSAMAAGVVLVVTAGMLFLLLGRGVAVAFADVVEQVKAAQAVRCKLIVEIDPPNGTKVRSESDALMVQPGWTIVTTPHMKTIMSVEKGRMLSLLPDQKQAMVFEMKNLPANAPKSVNLLDIFKNVDGKEGKPLGARTIAGHETRGFEVTNGGMLMKVWADVKTDLPVLVDLTPTSAFMPSGNYTMTDFDWSPTYDPAELSVEVPADYRVASVQMDQSKASEQDVAALLRTLAEANDGTFAEGVGMEAFTKIMAAKMTAREKAETAGMTIEQKADWRQKMTQDMMKLVAPIGRGWMYLSDAKEGSDWQYAGSGVKLGEKGRPVLWYKTAAGNWRVFDADLTVHDAKESDLPKGEPVKLNIPGAAQTRPAGTAPAGR